MDKYKKDFQLVIEEEETWIPCKNGVMISRITDTVLEYWNDVYREDIIREFKKRKIWTDIWLDEKDGDTQIRFKEKDFKKIYRVLEPLVRL